MDLGGGGTNIQSITGTRGHIKHLGSANYAMLSNDTPSPELVNFSYKGPGSKYFRLCEPLQSAGTTQVNRCCAEASTDNT